MPPFLIKGGGALRFGWRRLLVELGISEASANSSGKFTRKVLQENSTGKFFGASPEDTDGDPA